MLVSVEWSRLTDELDPRWDSERVLYAYSGPGIRRPLYIGKADFCTVRERWLGKPKLWNYIWSEFGLTRDEVLVFVGDVSLAARLSQELLEDIEGLLIRRIKPHGNVNTPGQIRDGLLVHCVGTWPISTTVFRYPVQSYLVR